MTVSEQAAALAAKLDEPASYISETQKYLSGTQPLSFLTADQRTSLKLSRMVSNIPSVQVGSIAERLRVTALIRDGQEDAELWGDFVDNDLDQQLPDAFRIAMGLRHSYAIVWDKTGRAKPKVTIEHPSMVTIDVDPGTRETLAGFKRWSVDGMTKAVMYLPDHIVTLEANGEAAVTGFRQTGEVANPLGVVPVVRFDNGDRSEIEDLKPLVDALNKLLADLMVGSEYYARPRRWATGVEMLTDEEGNAVNPFPEGDRMMIAEQNEARFGSLPAADLSSYEAAVKIIQGQIMAVSALPAHYLGQLVGQTPGADGLRAAEAALTARAEAKQARFGRTVEAIGRLCYGIRTESDPDSVSVKVRWADPATRSVAQEADAVVKLHQAGLLPADYALARLGYDREQIQEIRKARRAEELDRAVRDAARPGEGVDQP